MDADKIIQDLNRKFAAPLPEFYKRRIVVWYDEDREFEDQIDSMSITGADCCIIEAEERACKKHGRSC